MTDVQRTEPAILVVEDDPNLAQLLRDRFMLRGYTVWHAENAAEAEALVDSATPDVILVDLMLPDMHGLVLCANLREKVSAPIIICSGTQRKDDAVLALKLGAADFVPKPLSVDELEVRIDRALRQRSSGTPSSTADGRKTVGPLAMDLARHRVTVAGQEVQTTPTEYRLLCALADRPNGVVSIKELSESAWGHHDPSLGPSLGVHLRRLRAKLRSAPPPVPALVAVRGFGYRLAWEVDKGEET